MKRYHRFIFITFFFILLMGYVILLGKGYFYKEISINGIEITKNNAPKLKDLFPDRKNGPHQQFLSAESCLVCHKEKTNIGIGIAPKIPHSYKKNCTECHDLP